MIAGQGTIALEMLEDAPDLDMLVIPIGGGGLIAGNAVAARALKPSDRDRRGSRRRCIPRSGTRCAARQRPLGGPTLAEGIAVKNVGELTLPIVRELVSEIVLVDEAVAGARGQRLSHPAEDDGGRRRRRGLAAMLAKPERFRGRKVGLVSCAAAISIRAFSRRSWCASCEREDRIVSFRLDHPRPPGVLGQIADRLGELGVNILEVDHRRLLLDVPAKGAKLDVTVETRDRAHGRDLCGAPGERAIQPVRIEAATAME